jgi:hypothetical protein
MGDLMVALLGKQAFEELEELIFPEECTEDWVVSEGQLGALFRLDNLFHGAS